MTLFRSTAFAFVLLLLALSCQLTYGQESKSVTAHRDDPALREKAFKLLESLAGQIGSLQSVENRARIGSNIAGSLWPHDEQRARAMFQLVTEEIKLGLQRRENDPNPEHTLFVFLKLREDNVDRIAAHDPELALAFLKETLPVIKEAKRRPDGEISTEVLRREQRLELGLARRISAQNPDVALQLARRALEYGLSEELLLVLARLSDKKQAQAQLLFKDIVARLHNEDFRQNWVVMVYAQRLLGNFTPPAADESTYQELVNLFVNKAIAHGCANPRSSDHDELTGLCAQFGMLVPLIEKFYPAQAQRLKQWAPQDYRYKPDRLGPAYMEMNDVTANGTIDELLALRSKHPSSRSEIEMRAISKAEAAGDFERAKKIAGEFSGDESMRESLRKRVEQYHPTTAVLEEQLANVLRNPNNIPAVHQLRLLLQLAHYAAPHDRKFAVKVLGQVEGMLDTIKPGKEQTENLIALAMVYCEAKDDRGFAIMESLLPMLNELI
ncbi:MAG TPA: hypothetical protein VK893_02485, partial [Pyrinomonadaceae bacterium]|nr:hypothetical protein [Pyrinomonadaceae bacterium]